MKSLSKISLLAAGLATVLPFLNAADATTASNTPEATANSSAPGANNPRHLGMGHRRKMIAHRIARRLNLNDSQVAQIKTIRGSARTAVTSIRANESLTPDQKKAQILDVFTNSRTQMRAVLTPDQQAKLDEMKTRAWQRMGGF